MAGERTRRGGERGGGNPSSLETGAAEETEGARPREVPLREFGTAFTTKKDYGRGEQEAQWATTQHCLHRLATHDDSEGRAAAEQLAIAAQVMMRAEVARYQEERTLRGELESSVKRRGLELELDGVLKTPYYSL
ncbi:hypothetical protein ACP4OV_022587 [Aristida adscensionis]